LLISKRDGDTTGDGRIDRPTMLGTRSFSIWDAQTGERVFDSGSFFEAFALQHDADTYNMNRGDRRRVDTRSDNKGPEIEAVDVAMLGARRFLAVASERQNGVWLFRVDDPARPQFWAYANPVAGGDFSPESVLLIPGDTRPDGRHLLIAGFEGSGTLLIWQVHAEVD